jgi:cation:H+ antiporter
MLFDMALVLIGISLLVWSADRFTAGAAALARNLGVPRVIIGLTVVAIGSSAPEMFVSATAALAGTHGIAIGNAIGSNIVNIALVLSVTALVVPLSFESGIIRRELPLLIVISLITTAMLWDQQLVLLEGIVLLSGLAIYLLWLTWEGLKHRRDDKLLEEMIEELPDSMSNLQAGFWTVAGLVLLIVSSDLLVSGASSIARALGVSDLIIGLTIVAIGTSLPELAASLAAALKKEHEMVLGNIIGSNLFNLMGVVGIAAALSPQPVEPGVLTRDLPVMMLVTIGLYLSTLTRGERSGFGRWHAAVMLLIYLAYSAWLWLEASA